MIVRKSDGGFLYATTDLAAAAYRCGDLRADRVLYVTDAGQGPHFAAVFEAAKRAALVAGDALLEHVPFGLVRGEDGKKFKTRSGETVKLALMEGAVVAPLDPDLSIAPPTRVPGMASNGKLEMPHRMTRSRTTNDSSRQGANDGYLEYTSMNQTFYTLPEDRPTCPISIEPNFHGTWGGPVQIDGRTKSRKGRSTARRTRASSRGRRPTGSRRRRRS